MITDARPGCESVSFPCGLGCQQWTAPPVVHAAPRHKLSIPANNTSSYPGFCPSSAEPRHALQPPPPDRISAVIIRNGRDLSIPAACLCIQHEGQTRAREHQIKRNEKTCSAKRNELFEKGVVLLQLSFTESL